MVSAASAATLAAAAAATAAIAAAAAAAALSTTSKSTTTAVSSAAVKVSTTAGPVLVATPYPGQPAWKAPTTGPTPTSQPANKVTSSDGSTSEAPGLLMQAPRSSPMLAAHTSNSPQLSSMSSKGLTVENTPQEPFVSNSALLAEMRAVWRWQPSSSACPRHRARA